MKHHIILEDDLDLDDFTCLFFGFQEKMEETTAETRLCPLCQRRQKDIDALALHLTKKHSVHPACLDNLLITVSILISLLFPPDFLFS